MELISGEKTKELFKRLKEKYDYIFVDTPPVGMVADALILLKYSDINLYVIRHNYTLKKVFSNVVQNFQKRGITNINMVINDVPIGKKYLAYSQGYVYNYGYGYGMVTIIMTTKNQKPKKVIGMFKNFFKDLIGLLY
ncbi:MAG: CpsD/CapB family tyrosine-protein kinase [Chloroflexia bacterium]|nr:CpsD/CapB family tyrosine-protein kinase [Chloroflexia bacterium]